MKDYIVVIFYKFVKISDADIVRDEIYDFCSSLNIKGRVILGEEGINATLEGTRTAIDELKDFFEQSKYFKNLDIKSSKGDGRSFRRLSVKVRDEIVAAKLGDEAVDPNELTGKYISAEDLDKLIYSGRDDYVIIDMRNDYECEVGYFKDSIKSEMENFRDLKKYIHKIKKFKDKKVITVCTSGIRCEKASGYLIKKGFKDVYQLEGGIQRYLEKYPNRGFLGKLYVFDERIVVSLGNDKTVVGKCYSCGEKSENYSNCANIACHKQMIVCEKCLAVKNVFCSQNCEEVYNDSFSDVALR